MGALTSNRDMNIEISTHKHKDAFINIKQARQDKTVMQHFLQ